MPLSIQEIQERRLVIRNSARFLRPTTDYVIKSLRADEYCYFRKFVTMIAGEYKKIPLRRSPKKLFTVTGSGIFARFRSTEAPLKEPQYTSDKKQHFSKAQATSLGTPDFYPPVFGFDRRDKLVGAFFPIQTILLSDRLCIYDDGTVGRGYDAANFESAKKYFDAHQGTLFSSKQYEDFKQKIIKKEGPKKYNEVLARLQWDVNHCKLFIASDTLEARLIAQDYARILKNYLLQHKLCSSNYIIPIFFYIPDDPVHFKEYTLDEQQLDIEECQLIANNKELIFSKCSEKKFEFLLGLSSDKLTEVLSQHTNPIQKIFTEGYFHLLESLAEKNNCPIIDILSSLKCGPDENEIAFIKAASVNSAKMISILFDNMKKYFQRQALNVAVEQSCLEIVNFLVVEKKVNLDESWWSGETLLITAAVNGHLEIVKLLVENNWIIDYSSDGITPLYAAARNGHLEVVKYLLEKGARINARHVTTAQDNGHYEVVKAIEQKYYKDFLESIVWRKSSFELDLESIDLKWCQGCINGLKNSCEFSSILKETYVFFNNCYLEKYIVERRNQPKYLSIFGRFFGSSREDKLEAAEWLRSGSLGCNEKNHRQAFKNGRLGDVYSIMKTIEEKYPSFIFESKFGSERNQLKSN